MDGQKDGQTARLSLRVFAQLEDMYLSVYLYCCVPHWNVSLRGRAATVSALFTAMAQA